MNRFLIDRNDFLNRPVQAFYHTDYLGYRKQGNPDYINTFKNTYNSYSKSVLESAARELLAVLLEDLPSILRELKLKSLFVCVVPRAKASYHPNQLLFKHTVRAAVQQLNGFVDGIDSISRHTNTKTTHLPPNTPNFNNDGDMPYPGITTQTCNISSTVSGKDVLLIDDIYTSTVNIDEDAIQSLLNCGARSVVFYAIGKTVQYRPYR